MPVRERVDALPPGELDGDVLGPLVGVDEEPLVVELDIDASERGDAS